MRVYDIEGNEIGEAVFRGSVELGLLWCTLFGSSRGTFRARGPMEQGRIAGGQCKTSCAKTGERAPVTGSTSEIFSSCSPGAKTCILDAQPMACG